MMVPWMKMPAREEKGELSWDFFFLFPFWVWFSFSSRVTHNSESGLNDLYSSFQRYSLCAALDSVFFMCRVNDDDWEPEGWEKRSAGKCEGIDFSSMSYEMKMRQSGAWGKSAFSFCIPLRERSASKRMWRVDLCEWQRFLASVNWFSSSSGYCFISRRSPALFTF